MVGRSPAAGVDRRGMALLSAGHMATDFGQGAVPALLVFLVPRLGLSNMLAGVVVMVATAASSLVQPAFGLVSDRRGALWLLPVGVLLGGTGVALASVAPSYPALLVCVLVSGLGVAAYHPEGSKLASFVSGDRRASGMAFFSVGGNVGFALGPLVGGLLLEALGLNGGLLLAVPGVAAAAVLLAERRYLGQFDVTGTRTSRFSDLPDRLGAFSLLQVVVALRSAAHYGLFTFVPLYEVSLGRSPSWATMLAFVFLGAGAIGTLVGGPLADRLGRKPVIIASLALSVPLVLVYALVGGAIGIVAIAAAGACVVGTFGVTTVLSQEYLPSRIALASGLSIGLAIGLGGIFAIALGGLADSIDLQAAILAAAAGPALGAVLALALPSERRSRMLERAPATT
ncbi:MAG: MFS transporter [Gaiellales bacterium]